MFKDTWNTKYNSVIANKDKLTEFSLLCNSQVLKEIFCVDTRLPVGMF